MKNIFLILLMIFMCTYVHAQTENYYYLHGKKVVINLHEDMLYFTFSLGVDSSTANEIIGNFGQVTEQGDYNGLRHFYWVVVKLNKSIRINDLIEECKQIKNIESIQPVAISKIPTPISNIFHLKMKSADDYPLIEAFAAENKVEIIGNVMSMPLWVTLMGNKLSSGNSLELSNKAIESDGFANSDPNFMIHYANSCSNEPLFSQQWGINNSIGPDIKLCKAWNTTKGRLDVQVAVIDQGIELSNLEFANNIVQSLDVVSKSSPSQLYGIHGTHVGGIVGANENNNQIVGVAPLAGLFPISYHLNINPNYSADMAYAINQAWQKGASIINNSWGDQGGQFYSQMQSPALDDAINYAIDSGRGGWGQL